MNIERPLQFCRETDDWDEDSKFRFMIETSEPITSFLSSRNEATARELARRIREGRIQLGGLHSTVNTEQLGHELMARLFYLTSRHSRDLLGVPRNRTAQIDDVIGLTWPLATFCDEADVPYLFHGYNGAANCMQPASRAGVLLAGPRRRRRRGVLTRSYPYAADALGDGRPEDIERISRAVCKGRLAVRRDAFAGRWDSRSSRWTTRKRSAHGTRNGRTRGWSAPRWTCSSTPCGAGRSGQDQAFHRRRQQPVGGPGCQRRLALGQARRADEEIPTAEKFATIAQAVAGGGNSWTEIYQAYHRLLAWHEHTNAIFQVGPELELMRRYETELVENREMVIEARAFAAGPGGGLSTD